MMHVNMMITTMMLLSVAMRGNTKYDITTIGGHAAGSVSEISVMTGSSVSLPCNMTSSIPGDKVRLVLWYRDDLMAPIYSLDSREKPLAEARHWSDDNVLQGRAFYQASHSPGRLNIDSISIKDQAIYKCRVDFKVQPTTISHVKLSVNTPPGKPVIYDESGSEVRKVLGPYKLGDSVMIKCLVVGGRPSPEVTWWRDHHLVDDSFSQISEFKVENLLSLTNLQRSDVDSILTCQAKNSNNSLPVSTSVKLDMIFEPETVTIRGMPHSLAAGEKYAIKCEAVGSRPAANIAWRLGDTDVSVLQTKLETSHDGNKTSSTLSLVAEPHHHGKTISCITSVPGLTNSNKETISRINVHYISSASVTLGSSMAKVESVKEGEDVYLECKVQANPPPHKVSWFKDGHLVKQDVSGGIILSNMTLVIQSVTRGNGGEYTCTAANSEGQVESSGLALTIDHRPVCASDSIQTQYQVGLNQLAKVRCEVVAGLSSNLTFHWVFNTSKEIIDIQQQQMSVNGSVSTVDYIPRTVLDYGSLLCWADNHLGSQEDPCVFHLVPVQPPAPVSHCSINHLDMTSVNIKCFSSQPSTSKDFSYLLELRRTGGVDISVLMNLTSASGDWSLDNLDPGQEYKMSVLTRNEAGDSDQRYNSSFLTYQSEFAESRVHISDSANINSSPFVITPILGALIGVGVALTFVTMTIIIVVYCRTKHQPSSTSTPRTDSKEKELLSPDVAPRKILCTDDDDESGFERLYSDGRYSSLNRQLCNKNIFIVGGSMEGSQQHQQVNHFRTLQPRRCVENSFSERMSYHCGGDITSHSSDNYRCFTEHRNNRQPVTNNISSRDFNRRNIVSYASNPTDHEVQEPLLSPTSAPTTISTTSSTLSSSELNHSLTSSETTSDFSSEKDRESEV